MNWYRFRRQTERYFRKRKTKTNCSGFQIQSGTKWNSGLSQNEIDEFENILGFILPDDYRESLAVLNGFDRESIYYEDFPEPGILRRNCYKYPEDYATDHWLLEEIEKYRDFVLRALKESGFDLSKIVGFLPIYGHRALVAFEDKTLSPVISIVGDDVIVYGGSIVKYWKKERRTL